MIRIFVFLLLITVVASCHNKLAKYSHSNISFEKIIFHTSPCHGLCPTYHLEISANQQARLYAETVYNMDKGFERVSDFGKTGYFKGKVSDSLFRVLEKELVAVELDTLVFDANACCDGSIYTIIVYYQGKRKVLRSMFPPAKAQPLVDVLNAICSDHSFERTSQSFEIENEKIPD